MTLSLTSVFALAMFLMPVTTVAETLPTPASGFLSVKSGETKTYPLRNSEGFKLNLVSAVPGEFQGRKALAVTILPMDEKDMVPDPPSLVWLPIDFHDGVIEVDLASTLGDSAAQAARGFIGMGFRIGDGTNMPFEGIYLRPTNGRANDQVRRNHSVQYFSGPDYDFARMRKEFPEKYESYCDVQLNTWMTMRIEVQGEKARLYVDNSPQPVLVVNDLKRGPNAVGGVGVWVGPGTVGYFSNLRVTQWK